MIKESLAKRIEILGSIDEEQMEKAELMGNLIAETIENGHKVMTAGNGGSAANAQHITGDIVGRFKIERNPYAGVSLTVDPSVMTALSNDYGYEHAIERQVRGLGQEGDLLITTSSSATSPNLVEAVKAAQSKGIQTLGVYGNDGGTLSEMVDHAIVFPFADSDLLEEVAMTLFHIILEISEKRLVEGGY